MAGGGAEVVLASRRAREANRGLAWLVVISTAIHVAAGAGAVLAAGLRSRPTLEPASIPVELVTLGKPRDPALLPRKVKPRPRVQAEPEAQQGPEAPPPDAVVLESRADDRKKKRAAKPAPRRRLSRAARALLEGAEDARLDEALEKLEPPEGSPNGSAYGTTTDPSAAANTYEAKVKAHLQERYKLPLTVAPSQRRFLEAEVILRIDRQGRITRFEFIKRHANQAFMNALEGLLRTTQLPPPPPDLVRTYAREGLAIRFKP